MFSAGIRFPFWETKGEVVTDSLEICCLETIATWPERRSFFTALAFNNKVVLEGLAIKAFKLLLSVNSFSEYFLRNLGNLIREEVSKSSVGIQPCIPSSERTSSTSTCIHSGVIAIGSKDMDEVTSCLEKPNKK